VSEEAVAFACNNEHRVQRQADKRLLAGFDRLRLALRGPSDFDLLSDLDDHQIFTKFHWT
jgi:hypothetical protein